MTIMKIIMVLCVIESGNDPDAFNKAENAIGVLQIRPIMIEEYHRLGGDKSITHKDMWDRDKSIKVCHFVLTKYKKIIEQRKGSPVTVKELVRTWNGGFASWKPQKGQKEINLQNYYRKFINQAHKM